MKFTDADRAALVRALAPAVVALKLTTPPAKRDGSTKKGLSIDFVAAVWIKRYAETIVRVCEAERDDDGGAGFPS